MMTDQTDAAPSSIDLIWLRFKIVVSNVLKYLSDASRFAFLEGSWKIDELEKNVIEAVIGDVDIDASRVIRGQLSKTYFISRYSKKRICIFYFYNYALFSLIENPAFDDCLFKVRIKIDSRIETANVTFYRGRIFSVEFRKPRSFYNGKEMEILGANLGASADTVTRLLDRAEHGHETDENRA